MLVKRILFLGEICADKARQAVIRNLENLKKKNGVSFVIANGENVAGGYGITAKLADDLFKAGVDCITTGDHFLDRREAENFFDAEPRILRPLNYPDKVCGHGYGIYEFENCHIGVINLLGRVFLKAIDCPFQKVEKAVDLMNPITSTIIVDFHAEATAEKVAMGWFLDGKVSAVLGSHTHVQTADERILPNGTAYITDVGMCGPFDSVIGMRIDLSLKRIINAVPVRLHPAKSNVHICAVLLDLDTETGKALAIQRINLPVIEAKRAESEITSENNKQDID
jgi:hypothetical protein